MEPEKVKEDNPKSSTSVFPLFPLSSNPNPNPNPNSNNPQWLSNPSFTFDVSSIPLPAAPSPPPASPSSDELPASAAAPSYDLVGSDASDEERRRRRRRDKRKRKRGGEEREGSGRSRVRNWRESEPAVKSKSEKDYYFDVRGDHDNLVYGSLYRMDVARYSLHFLSDLSGLNFQLFRWRPNSSMDVDGDADVLDSKLKTGGRYCSIKYTTLERHTGLKHVKIVNKASSIVSGEYIPLLDLPSSLEDERNLSLAKEDVEESWDDEVIRKTRELNKMSRDFPHDEKVWLAFAEFQGKIASTQRQKAARLQTLEKKISILEKAVELNPDNEDLLLCLLKSYKERDSSGVIMERWEKVLIQHSDSVRLWKEFLVVCQGEFSQFKVSDMRSKYAHAIHALSTACEKLSRQGCYPANLQAVDVDPFLLQLELGLVDIFICLCKFEWQTGFQELATGLFQAEIEYTLFPPSLHLSSQSKRRLFEHFWNSGGARLGEDEAIGWSKWLEIEEENKHQTMAEEIPQETEPGGWTGWSDPTSKKTLTEEEPGKPENSPEDEQTEEDLDNEGVPDIDDIELLLKKLGVNVDAEPHTEVKDTKTWNRWSEEEVSRDSAQWMPVREHYGNLGGSPHPKDNRDEGMEQLSRVILFEDVNDYLFSLCTEESRFSLVSQFIDFYGGRISRWSCSNSSSWFEKLLSLETVPDSLSEDLRVILQVPSWRQQFTIHPNLDVLFGNANKLLRDNNVMKFLRNAILLLLKVFPRNHILEEALLAAEELFMKSMNSSTCSVNPSRALAKSLLKNDRQDLLLCGVYAKSEATYGNIDVARKIFDMALSSTDGLPPVLKEYVPLLYLWYAEMEMEIVSLNSNSESQQRAVHILSCLGSTTKYIPFKCQPSGLQILRARQGFKEQSKALRSAWARGDIKEYSVALICSASLFESLTAGLAAGIEVIEEAFSTVLPERRSKSLQLESLWIYYIGMLQKHIQKLKFSRVWESIVQGLQLYPYNPKSFTSMVEVSSHYTVPYKVRRIFDESIQRKPSVIVWLVALSYELSKPDSQHRVHRLFEKALSNDRLQKSVLLWRCYLAYEADIANNPSATRRVFFRAIHACPWSKRLWLDGFQKLSSILTAKELSDLQEVMRDKELNLRTDIYEILLQDETES